MCHFTHKSRDNFCQKFTLICREVIFVANLRTFECKIFRSKKMLVQKSDKYQVCIGVAGEYMCIKYNVFAFDILELKRLGEVHCAG